MRTYRVSRKDKKKIRTVSICLTWNVRARKVRYSKKKWVQLKIDFTYWIQTINIQERRLANTVK